MKFKPPPKRKKVDSPHSSSDRPPVVSTLEKRDVVMNLLSKPMGHQTGSGISNQMLQQARNNAVAQAQQDGCTANYRIFDSQYGNYLVPVIPTRAELGG